MVCLGLLAQLWQSHTSTARLAHVLNLKTVPDGVAIIDSEADVWTDEVLHFVLRLDEGKLEEILSGREYKKTLIEPEVSSHSGKTFGLHDFKPHIHFSTGEGLWGVWMDVSEDESLAYVMFAAD